MVADQGQLGAHPCDAKAVSLTGLSPLRHTLPPMVVERRIQGEIGPRHVPPITGPIRGLDLGHLLGRWPRRRPMLRTNPTRSRVVGAARRTRPMLTVVDGRPEASGTPWTGKLAALADVLPAVCKIDPATNHSATGVLLTGHLVLTNQHVAARIESRLGDVPVWFGWESDRADVVKSTIVDVVEADDRLDVAVVRLDPPPAIAPPSFIGRVAPEVGMEVAAVGYPTYVLPGAGDELADQLLGGTGVRGRKRVSPGVLRSVSDDALGHDCSTVHGSSGSPLVELTTGTVVGLHAGGSWRSGGRLNQAAPISAAMRLRAVADALAAGAC